MVRERLEAAFAALERAGLIAMEHAGWDDVEDEQVFRSFQGRPARGYCFSCSQARELRLAFGAFGEDHGAIGREIVDILNTVGLRTRWNRSADDPIVVEMHGD